VHIDLQFLKKQDKNFLQQKAGLICVKAAFYKKRLDIYFRSQPFIKKG